MSTIDYIIRIVIFSHLSVVIQINIVEFLQIPDEIVPSNASPGEQRNKEPTVQI